MLIPTRRRAAAATATLGAAVVLTALSGGLAGAATGTAPSRSGNFEYTQPQYYCTHNVPAVAGYFRTLGKSERAVSLILPGVASKNLGAAKPWTPGVYAAAGLKGANGKIAVRGASTGTGFTVMVTLPASCQGLPTTRPAPPQWVVATASGSGTRSGPPVVTDGPAPATGSNSVVLRDAGLLGVALLAVGAGTVVRLRRRA